MKGRRVEGRGGGYAGGEGGQLVGVGSLQLVPTLLGLHRIHFKCHLQHKITHSRDIKTICSIKSNSTGSLTCLRKDRGDGLDVGGAMRGGVKLRGDRG